MSRKVKSSRSYDSTTRRARSAQTRQRVLDAARTLILERGYRGATIAAIASEAGVNVDTIYELVGRKPLILRELIEQAISGTDHAITAEERDYVQAIRATPDAEEKLVIYAHAVCQIQARMAPLHLALRDASSTDPEAAQVWQEISERRATNMRRLVEDLKGTGRLRPDISVDDAADLIWATNSAEFYVMLTVDRGWSSRRYERRLAEIWRRSLLT